LQGSDKFVRVLTGGAGREATTKGPTSLPISITRRRERGEIQKNPPARQSMERL
jgi:hypothetical protein